MPTRRALLRHAGLAGILAAGSSPAMAVAGRNIRWRLASSFPRSMDALFGAADRLSRNLADATGGRFSVSTYAAGEVVPAFSVVDAVQNRTVDCAHTAPYYFTGKDEAFAFDCAIPFGMNSRQLTAWMFEGNGLKLMREFYARYDIVNFVMGNSGTQMGGWFRKEIRTVADLQGMRFRIGGFGSQIFERLGAVPQTIPLAEVYSAMERGALDAVEFVAPYDDLRLGLHKAAPYYYAPAWWEGSGQLALYVNARAWAELPDDYKRLVQLAASDAHIWVQAAYDARNPPALKQLIAEGAKLMHMPRELMDAAWRETEALYAELDGRNPQWRRIFADYRRFQRDQVQWHAVAEDSYNQYLANTRL
ncbi:MAG: TRAP transporter substrate-binding protein DctP [Pseudazoarcus pumilus]|nr:TRAP transporter substrate-binding protein DctP [Pseudazoarcus pumilus]